MHLDDNNGSDPWVLTPADLALVMAKNRANRLGFALLLLFYRNHGRFPPSLAGIDAEIVVRVARQLGLDPGLQDRHDLTDRTWKRHRAEIRTLSGFREATIEDAERLEAWLYDQAVAVGGSQDRLAALAEARCLELSIEPPSTDRLDRIVRAALHAHDERSYADILARLAPAVRSRLEALLRPADSKPDDLLPESAAGTAPAVPAALAP